MAGTEEKKKEDDVDTGTADEEEGNSKDEECAATEHRDKFNPTAYLNSFYKTASEDTAMQIVLFFLPGILYRLPQKVRTVLDLGAGPTVYLPIALRERAENIYTSDYAPANRDALVSWIENRSTFDWDNVCSWISNIEASMKTGKQMQEKTRSLMRAVLDVNVHESPVVQSVVWKSNQTTENIPGKFEVVSTVFCLEYSCETLDGYFRAVRSACSLIEDGGFLIQGGVLDATTYNFGGKTFRCHRLKQAHILESLKANGMATTAEKGYKFITHDDIFFDRTLKNGQKTGNSRIRRYFFPNLALYAERNENIIVSTPDKANAVAAYIFGSCEKLPEESEILDIIFPDNANPETILTGIDVCLALGGDFLSHFKRLEERLKLLKHSLR
ncbi:hypothetical protein L3Y34_002787 [Caenorhabditis briggsae]|nr:hypothetical protein L3Y34_002787 [Caenorhabditis briggsae]